MIYAVNKRTKEHVKVIDDGAGPFGFDLGWVIVQADDDGWIEWHGGECPLPHNSKCNVKDGAFPHEDGDEFYASAICWGGPRGTTITHYRPILDADTKPESPAWDGEGLPPVGCECSRIDMHGGIKRVLIVGHDVILGRAIYRDPDWSDLEYDSGLEDHFRPIRSEEDRAVDSLLEAMLEIAPIGTEVTGDVIGRGIYNAIRDGKIPGVRLDD